MDTLVLQDKNSFPDETVSKAALKNSYPVFEKLSGFIAGEDVRIEWRYYNDGKAWMGKMFYGKAYGGHRCATDRRRE